MENILYRNTFGIENRYRIVLIILGFFSLLFAFISSNIFVNLALIVCFVLILLVGGFETGFYAYMYLVSWERFTTLPVFSSISYIGIILAAYIILSMSRKINKVNIWDFILLLIVALEGMFSYFVSNSFSGMMLLIDVIIVLGIYSILQNKSKDEVEKFWNRLFLYLYIGSLLSLVWGTFMYLQGDVATVYIGEVSILRLTTTVGTDRACMLLCTGMIYPIYYMKNRIIKIISIVVLTCSVLATVSMAAILCLAVFFIIVLFHKYRHIKSQKKAVMLIFLIVMIGYLIYSWNYMSGIGALDTVIDRLKQTIFRVNSGDLAAATTGRSDLLEAYWNYFKQQNLFAQLFGSGYTTAYNIILAENYSHNTFIDMLIYFGIFPLLLILIRTLVKSRKTIQQGGNVQFLLLKTVYIITALGVSMLTNSYWWIFFIL